MSPRKLGMKVKRLREERGWTQQTLASRAKLHRVYVAQIEAQTKTPSIVTLERLAKVFKVKLTELLE